MKTIDKDKPICYNNAKLRDRNKKTKKAENEYKKNRQNKEKTNELDKKRNKNNLL